MMNFTPANLRKTILNMAKDKAGHLGCAFSLVEVFSALYGLKLFNYNPNEPNDPNRDYLCLSKGHGAMAAYSCFYELGWINDHDIENYFLDESNLFGLIEDHIPGVEVSGGSLGHGFVVSVGIAYGLKLQRSTKKVYCIIGDGEMNEGSVWEAILFAGHHNLKNLIVIVDANDFQAMGRTNEIMNMEPLDKKMDSFGFHFQACNGHSLEELELTIKKSQLSDRPSLIQAHTIKGAGVDFMEEENLWHYNKLVDKDLYAEALRQVDSGRKPGVKS